MLSNMLRAAAGNREPAIPAVIQAGLSIYLDADVSSSYPGTGTTWTDLSGNSRNGTLINGPTFNSGAIVFDGTNDYVQCSGSLVTSAATFITWLKRNGTQSSYDGIFFSRGTNTTGLGIGPASNSIGYTWNDAGSTYDWGSGLIIPDATWCMVALTVTSTSAIAYLCQSSGITTSTNTVSHASTTLNDIKIAQDDFGGRFFNGSISVALLYNRALSASEITTTFNLFKNRYGL